MTTPRPETANAERALDRADAAALEEALLGDADAASTVDALAARLEANALADLDRSLLRAKALVDATASLRGPQRARALLAFGHVLAYANRLPESVAALADALPMAAPDARLAARVRMARVHPLSRTGRVDEAIDEARAARAVFLDLGDGLLAAKASANLGVLHKARHEPLEALRECDAALPAFRAIPAACAQLESNRGEILLELGRFEEAETAFRGSLAALDAAGLRRAAAIVEGNLADLLGRLGRVSDATAAYERARRLHEESQAAGDLARLRAEQAELFAAAGLLEEARLELAEAIRELERCGLSAEAARARRAAASVLVRLHAPRAAAEALAPLRIAAPGAGRPRAGREEARLTRAEGEIALASDDARTASELLAKAAALDEPDSLDRALTAELAAQAWLALGELDAAESEVAIALPIAKRLRLGPLAAELLRVRAACARRRGERAAAEADLRAACELVDHARSSLQAERFRSAFAATRSAVHEAHAALLAEDPSVEPAALFAAVERGRHRTLLERLAAGEGGGPETSAQARAGPDRGHLAAESRRLAGLVNGWISRVDDVAADGSAFDAWRQGLAEAEEALRVVEARMAADAREDAGDVRPLALDELRRSLPDDAALVEWIVADGRVGAIVVRREGAEIVRTSTAEEEIADALGRWELELARRLAGGSTERFAARLAEDARRSLDRLGGLLLAPIASAVARAARVHHVPAGPLHAVPFQALRHEGRYAIELAAVTSTPSASLVHALRAQRPSSGRGMLVVGVADGRSPAIDAEVERVLAASPDARALRGSAATREVVAVAATEARHIHLACHGRFPAGSPRSAGLLLADGWLTVREIERWRVPGATVVLSSCDSGRAARTGGDETIGLVRAFLAAGAARLVVAGWPVHDASAAELMSRAYRPAARHRSFDSALRQSILDAIAAGAHPALWAPYTVIGAP